MHPTVTSPNVRGLSSPVVMVMASKEELLQALEKMVSKVGEPKMEKKFRDFHRLLLMTFTDLEIDVSINFEGVIATITEGTLPDAHLTITTDSDTIVGILDGSVSAMRSFMGGKIKANGPTRDLLKLQHLLKA